MLAWQLRSRLLISLRTAKWLSLLLFLLSSLSWAYSQEQHCKALVIYKEANLEPIQGQREVLQVLNNRIAAHHSSCIKEISKAGQWSFYSKYVTFKADRKQLTQYTEVTKLVPLFPEATHFHAQRVRPKWARKMKYLGKVGHHYFYTLRRE